ncbi:MAG: hypothetical protein NT027_00205 [Proteobacteria bacterium]|nr:hypothetical protein [Pseudomonadota bacterium]
MQTEIDPLIDILNASGDIFVGTLKTRSNSLIYGSQKITAKFQVNRWIRGGFYGKNTKKQNVTLECRGHCELIPDQLYLVFLLAGSMDEFPRSIIPINPDDALISRLLGLLKPEVVVSHLFEEPLSIDLDLLIRKIIQAEFPTGGKIRIYYPHSDRHFETNYFDSDVYNLQTKKTVKFTIVKGIHIGIKTAPYIEFLAEKSDPSGTVIVGQLSNGKKFSAVIGPNRAIALEVK